MTVPDLPVRGPLIQTAKQARILHDLAILHRAEIEDQYNNDMYEAILFSLEQIHRAGGVRPVRILVIEDTA